MADELRHERVTDYLMNKDGTVEIYTGTAHHSLASYKRERLKNIQVSNQNLLSEVVGCLDVLKGKGTSELHISIFSGENGIPYRMTKQWVVDTEKFEQNLGYK